MILLIEPVRVSPILAPKFIIDEPISEKTCPTNKSFVIDKSLPVLLLISSNSAIFVIALSTLSLKLDKVPVNPRIPLDALSLKDRAIPKSKTLILNSPLYNLSPFLNYFSQLLHQ